MGLFEKLTNELIDIIEWLDDSRHTLVWRFPRYHNEIKNGAQLIVRPGQKAVFVHRGQIADIFEPGSYTLTADNLPILSTLQGWKYGFNSPFRSEVYFVSTRQVTDLKWGTPNPIMLRDPDFGPIRLRAFGTYSLKATDPKALLQELVGTDQELQTDEITELIRSMIVSSMADMLGKQQIAALDLASNYRALSDTLRQHVAEQIDDEYGLALPQLIIVNISLPEEVEKALDTRSSMGVIGDMNQYQQFQMGKAMMAAADNPSGGGAAEGMGLGMGFAMANRMAQQPALGGNGGFGMAPPPPPIAQWHIYMDGKQQGPVGLENLAGAIQAGNINKSTNVWSAGMDAWKPAGEVPALAAYFASGATPPPPPPAG
ncbi:SPFH domain / Band 7 family protein [Polystyrenella longa]|uniref:SPFH domain / Band 7 family protein n=1 Tax=Polystyrenella longa TaxID=2528007 RepID=A0A518CIV9_9PLAN|nr:SPFH domain-containing protein [Polystyrenella longa]QDU79163.1 SPFH domain / Band 7 family protein [Polystyrenella longa]